MKIWHLNTDLKMYIYDSIRYLVVIHADLF